MVTPLSKTSEENNNSFPLRHKVVKLKKKDIILCSPPHLSIKCESAWHSAYFPPQSFSQSVSFSAVWQKEEMSANRFFRELRAVTSAFAVTDEVGKSDGQLQSFLSPRACLALTLCAMFSEGTCHSAVAQADRQMVHIDTEHERDWQSSNESLGGPSQLKGEGFSSPLLGSSTSTARPHMDIKVPMGPDRHQRRYPSNMSHAMKENSLRCGLGLICFHLISMNHDHILFLLQVMEPNQSRRRLTK